MAKKSLKLLLIIIVSIFLISCRNTKNPIKDNDENIPFDEPPTPHVDIKTYEETIIENMTVKEKVGQFVIVGFAQNTVDEQIEELITYEKVGGFILFKRNFNSFNELYELNSKLKSINKDNKLPLFISVDEEGGSVSRLPEEGVKFPDAATFGRIDDMKITEDAGSVIGRQLNVAGINMNFAPILDILTNNNNKLFKLRCYGKDAETVSRHGIAFTRGLISQGIIPVGKHFPGHGDTENDSHVTLPVIDADYTLLKKRELVPFLNAIDAGLEAIMIGHLSIPKLDDSGVPASKSKIIITNILRNELGFQGIVITDDIEMKGFLSDKKALEESIIDSFNAGVDIFIIGHTKDVQIKVLNALMSGIEDGLITEERVNQSLKRIISLKHKYSLSNIMNYSNPADAYDSYNRKEDWELLEEIKNRIKKTG